MTNPDEHVLEILGSFSSASEGVRRVASVPRTYANGTPVTDALGISVHDIDVVGDFLNGVYYKPMYLM